MSRWESRALHPSVEGIAVGAHVAYRNLDDTAGHLIGRVEKVANTNGDRYVIATWPRFDRHREPLDVDRRSGQCMSLTGIVVVDFTPATTLGPVVLPAAGHRPELVHVADRASDDDKTLCWDGREVIAGAGEVTAAWVRERMAAWDVESPRACVSCAARALLLTEG